MGKNNTPAPVPETNTAPAPVPEINEVDGEPIFHTDEEAGDDE